MDEIDDQLALHKRTQTICLLVLTAIAIGAALYLLRPVLVPFVLALFISVVVTPVMDLLHLRLRFPRGLAIAATMLLGVTTLVLLGALVSNSLGELVADERGYSQRLEAFQNSVDEWVGEVAAEHEVLRSLRLDRGLDTLTELTPAMFDAAITWAAESGFTLLSRGVLVLIFMMFLITGHRGPRPRDDLSLSAELRRDVKEYLRVKVITSALTGALVYTILRVIGIDLALVFGLSAFFLNFIPNIGSIVSVLLPVPVVLLAGPEYDAQGNLIAEGVSVTGRVLAILLPGLVQFFVGNVLEPNWMGSSLDLKPVVILLSLIFWGMLWGPVGMLLSVPITSILRVLLERLSYTRPIAELLADRPPVRPEDLAKG